MSFLGGPNIKKIVTFQKLLNLCDVLLYCPLGYLEFRKIEPGEQPCTFAGADREGVAKVS